MFMICAGEVTLHGDSTLGLGEGIGDSEPGSISHMSIKCISWTMDLVFMMVMCARAKMPSREYGLQKAIETSALDDPFTYYKHLTSYVQGEIDVFTQ